MRTLKNLLLFGLTLILPLTAFAQLPAGLKQDLSPLEGYLIMPMDKQFLIDLDASKGLHSGDIFSIIEPGKKITHPVTGEVIGTLDGSKTFLQVTQLKSGYSYAKQLDQNPAPQRGQKLTRFQGVPSRYVDQTGQDAALRNELEKELTHLDWLSESAETRPLLIFERSAARLTVKNASGRPIGSYPLEKLSSGTIGSTQAGTSVPAPPTAILPASAPTPDNQDLIIKSDRSGIWHTAEVKDKPIAIVAADLDSDGQIETATLSRKMLRVYRFAGQQPQLVASLKISTALNPVALDIYTPSSGAPMLCLSALRKGQPSSMTLDLNAGKLRILQQDIAFLLRRLDSESDGAILLGQKRRDLDVPFNTRPLRLEVQNNRITEVGPFELPERLNLFGFVNIKDEKTGTLFAYLTESDYLKVRSTQDALWESTERFGGTETSFDLKAENNDVAPLPYFIPARILAVGPAEILTYQNDGTRMTSRFRSYKKGHFVSLKWNGLSMEENWRTTDQSGYIADFTLADIDNDGVKEVAAFTQFQRKTVFSKPRSALVIYEIE